MANTFWKSLGFSKLKNMSFGLFAGIFLLWTIFNASSFVPEGLELKYTLVFLGYGVLGVYIFGRQDLQTKLSKISLLGALPYFLIMTVVSFFLISFLLGVVDPFPLALVTALAGVPLYLQLSNALIFAVVETSFWQGHLDEKIGIFGSMIIAGFFHMFLWSGSLLANFVGASLLFGVFSTVNFTFRKKYGVVVALVLTIACHVGYNLAKYRIMFGV